MHFIFATLGTKGDLLPVMAVAAEMVRRGHRCSMLANESFEPLAARHGIRFCPVAPQQKNNLTDIHVSLRQNHFPSYERSFSFFREQVQPASPTVVVNLHNYSASSILAELYGLPICRLYLAPYNFRSLISPYVPLKTRCEGPLGRVFREFTLPKIYAAWDKWPFLLDHMNEYRSRWGLPSSSTINHAELLIQKHLALFPRWYCEPAPDWPAGLEMAGFVQAESSPRLPAAFQELVATQGRPLVFTPGTGVSDVKEFFTSARQCCEKLAMPGVFLSPHGREDWGATIRHFDFLDLEPVLRHAAALVHHGGIGTTARAFQAGIPQVISPQLYDQPDNGYRVECLGAGRVVERLELSGNSLASAIRDLLDSTETHAALDEIRQRMAQCDAAHRAADCLEQTFVRTRQRAPGGQRTAPSGPKQWALDPDVTACSEGGHC